MTYCNIQFKNFNRQNSYNQYFVDLSDKNFVFTLRWNNYCQCAYLSISDFDDNLIIGDTALTNGTVIRSQEIPYALIFLPFNDKKYEPNIDNLTSEFALFYEDYSEE